METSRIFPYFSSFGYDENTYQLEHFAVTKEEIGETMKKAVAGVLFLPQIDGKSRFEILSPKYNDIGKQ